VNIHERTLGLSMIIWYAIYTKHEQT